MIDRRVLLGLGVSALLAAGLAGCASQASGSTTSSAFASAFSVPGAGGAMPSGAAGGGGTGTTMTAASTAKLAKLLGVTSAELMNAITVARSSGAGVNLVRTLSSELYISETKVAAGVKAMGSDGP